MFKVTLEAVGDLEKWLRLQTHPEQAALKVLETFIAQQETPYGQALEALSVNAATMPTTIEFELTQVIGSEIWTRLDRASRLAFGKHVKANAEQFGLQYVCKSTANHSIYKRLA